MIIISNESLELLKYLNDNGIIDLSSIQEKIEMNNKKELLKSHPFKMWQGKDGKWYSYLPDEEKGRVLKKRNTKSELEQTIISYWKEKNENPTIKEVFDEWNTRRMELEKISEATFLRNKQIFSRHFKEFGEKRIKNIEPEEIGEFLEEQIPKFKLTSKSFSNLKSITRGFLKRAKKRKLISYNIDEVLNDLDTTDSDFKKTIKEDYEEVFSEAETEKILYYLIDNKDLINLGILLIFVTGLRIGELVALKHSDFNEYSVNVRRTETRYKNSDNVYMYEIKDFPKSAAGVRTIVIPEDFRWIIKSINEKSPDTEFVFVKDGARVKAQAIRRRLYRICSKLNIYPKSPHKIRKTYGTILLDNQVDKRLILEQMGHADILCTEDHYHRNRKSQDRKSEIISNIPDFKLA